MNCRMNLAESHLKEDDLSILGRMMLYIFQKKNNFDECVFPDIHLQTCMLRCLGRAVAYPYRLRKTQGVTVCAKGRGSPLHGCWPGTPLNREV